MFLVDSVRCGGNGIFHLSVVGLARFRATQDTTEIFEFANDAIAKGYEYSNLINNFISF